MRGSFGETGFGGFPFDVLKESVDVFFLVELELGHVGVLEHIHDENRRAAGEMAELGPEGAYGKIIRVELLHKLHDELKYDGLDALTKGIQQDCIEARAWFTARI